MSWTVLRITEKGVILRDFHVARFAAHPPAIRAAVERFCAEGAPGSWSLEAVGDELRVLPRGPSRLVDGMPVRYAVSPIAHVSGPIAKPPPGGPYAAVRVDGVATLLTSADGNELFESCSASIVAWDGAKLVMVPDDRPRVLSSAEAALKAANVAISLAIRRDASMPAALVNAVKGVGRPAIPGRAPFPDEAAAVIAGAFDSFTKR